MAKLSARAGLTLHVGSVGNNEYGKWDFEVTEIDTSIPLEPQLLEVAEALPKLYKVIYDKLDALAADALSMQIIRRTDAKS